MTQKFLGRAALNRVSISAILFGAYVVLAVFVGRRALMAFDVAATGVVQSIATPTLDWVGQRMSYLAAAELCSVWAVGMAYWLWRRGFDWRAAAPLLLFLSVPIEIASKILVLQPDVFDEMMRIDMRYHLLVLKTGNTFPSGNAMRTLMVYGLMGWLLVRRTSSPAAKIATAVPIAAFIVVVGMSRAYVGYHWFTDVVGAFLLGGSILTVMIEMLRGARRPVGAGDRADAEPVGLAAARFPGLSSDERTGGRPHPSLLPGGEGT